jgi:hypothetical protein
VKIGRLHHLQTVGIGTARWFVLRGVVVRASRHGGPCFTAWWSVLHGVASVVTDLRREPRRGSLLVVAGLGGSRSEKRSVGLSWWWLVVFGWSTPTPFRAEINHHAVTTKPNQPPRRNHHNAGVFNRKPKPTPFRASTENAERARAQRPQREERRERSE